MRASLARAYAAIPRWLKITVGVTAASCVIGAYGYWTLSLGRGELEKIARERRLCKIEGCADGIYFVETTVATHYNVSPTTVEWCLGVDDWRRTRVYRGGLIKSILVDFMDMPCGAMSASRSE